MGREYGKKNITAKADPLIKAVVCVCIGVLFLMLFLIVLRLAVKNVLYEKLGIYNGFVAFMLEGDNAVQEEDASKAVNIDWAALYPYDEADIYRNDRETDGIVRRYLSLVSKVKSQAEWYAADGLPMQTKFTEWAAAYESLIGWKVQEQDYDAVITLRNRHLTCVCPYQEVDEITDSVAAFKDFLDARDIELMYVMVPFKVDTEDPELPLGIEDASNENADRLLAGLERENIDYIDLRACEKEDALNHYDMFYYTDHHWKAWAAVWACGRVAEKMQELYGFEYDSGLFDFNNYTQQIYPDVFLGSYGRRVTLSKASPEDFEILLPVRDMNFRLYMPEKNVDATGSFADVFIDYDMLTITDYYEMDAYSSYVTLRKYVAVIENGQAQNQDKKILILRDSFGNNFGPYFAQQYGTVELLDVSSFTGSIKSYIEESRPDAVLLLYNPTMIEPIDWSSYTSSKFDFR